MRGSSFVIGAALLLGGGLNLLLAQHGGGGHSSGGHASGGFSSGSHAGFSSGARSYAVAPRTIHPTSIYPTSSGINRGALNPVHGGRGGYGVGRGYRGGFYYLPPYYFGDYDYGYGYDSPYAYNQAPQDYGDQTADTTSNMLGDQVAQLSAQVEALQNQRDVPYAAAPVPMRGPYNAPPAMAEDETPSSPPLTLVLRDGKADPA